MIKVLVFASLNILASTLSIYIAITLLRGYLLSGQRSLIPLASGFLLYGVLCLAAIAVMVGNPTRRAFIHTRFLLDWLRPIAYALILAAYLGWPAPLLVVLLPNGVSAGLLGITGVLAFLRIEVWPWRILTPLGFWIIALGHALEAADPTAFAYAELLRSAGLITIAVAVSAQAK